MLYCEVRSPEAGGNPTLVLTGEATIQHARELKSALAEALDGTDRLTVDAREVTAFDLSCLQIFCSAHRSALASSKELLLASGRNRALTETLERAGFCQRRGCENSVEDEICLLADTSSNE